MRYKDKNIIEETTRWIGVSLNILVTVNVNGLNASKKKDHMIGFFKKPVIFCL